MPAALKEFEKIGTKYNDWTIIGPPEKLKGGYHYLCECVCGNTNTIYIYNLKHNRTTHCRACTNHSKRKDATPGEKFGDWEVLTSPTYRQNVEPTCLCRCKCGKEQNVSLYRLRHKGNNQCRDCFISRMSLPVFEKIWKSIKAGADRRGLILELTVDDFSRTLENQKYICALSGRKLVVAKNSKDHNKGGTTASLDRKENSKGYTLDNIQWVHKDINWFKNNNDDKDFISLCREVAKHNPEIDLHKLKGLLVTY